MKVIILSSLTTLNDLETFGKDLLDELKINNDVVVYEEHEGDFSNVKDLFTDEDKIVMFNPEMIKGRNGFELLTSNLPKFRGIQYLLTPYSYYDGLDIELLKKLGIKYRNNGGANARSVAQYALTTSLMLLGRFPELAGRKIMPDGSILGEEILSKSAGVVGMGNIGAELLNLLRGLGIPVKYFNRTRKNVDAQRVSFEEIFQQDLVFFTIASGVETRKMFENVSSLVKDHNYIVDISATDDFYDKQALLRILLNGGIQG